MVTFEQLRSMKIGGLAQQMPKNYVGDLKLLWHCQIRRCDFQTAEKSLRKKIDFKNQTFQSNCLVAMRSLLDLWKLLKIMGRQDEAHAVNHHIAEIEARIAMDANAMC
jgi:hypothetical protein